MACVITTDGTVLEVEESTGTDGFKLVVRARHPDEGEDRWTIVFIASGQPRLAIWRIRETWFNHNSPRMGKRLELIRRTGNNFLRKPGGSLLPKKST